MTSPLTYYTIRAKDVFQVDFEEPLYCEGVNPNDLRTSRKYRFKNFGASGILPEGCEPPNDDETIQGIMSPTDYVTLPPYTRKQVGISKDATSFAFIHPPPSLADYLSNIGWGLSLNTDTEDIRLQISSFSICGAFIYFNDKMENVGINILSPIKTKNKLQLGGPYPTSDIALKEVIDLGRFSPIPTEITHEMGVLENAWTSCGEKFQTESATAEGDCTHGAFVYRCDNGESFTYVVTTGAEEMDVAKEFGQLSSQMDLTGEQDNDIYFFDKFKPTSTFMTHIDHQQLTQRIASLLAGRMSTSVSLMKHILNEAIKNQRPLEEIEKLMRMHGEGNLNQLDHYGWTSLHYACRFMPDNDSLVLMLLENSPDAAHMPDRFNRFPLHLACDSGTSVKVIKLLLKTAWRAVLEPTLYLQRLPLHLACRRGFSREIICALLDADKDGQTLRRKTKGGRHALHFALEMKIHDVSEVLLQADTRLNNPDVDFNSDYDDIYQICNGISPLHFACAVGVNPDVVRLLLEKDGKNLTIFQTVGVGGASTEGNQNDHDNDGRMEPPLRRRNPKRFSFEKQDARNSLISSKTLYTSRGMRALHLALMNNATEISRLVLRHEKQASESIQHRQKMANLVDVHGRTCLHLACTNNMEPDIIKVLLDLDPSRISTTLKDDKGCTPLHLACMHKSAKTETMQMLLDAESEYSRNHDLGSIRSISTVNSNGRNPLSVAISAGASSNVLELFLKPKYFDMTGMGPGTNAELAFRVNHDMPLQRALNLTISQRSSFMWLTYNLLSNVVALVAFSVVIDPVYERKKDQYYAYFVLLAVACASFCVRELAQMVSQRSRYFLDSQNVFDFINVLFLALSLSKIDDMTNNQDDIETWDTSKRFVFTGSGILLCIHTLFSLRSFFLPFARFARGTEVIIITLIPFFVTSSIMLLMFTQIFRIRYQDASILEGDCENLEGSLQCNCKKSRHDCWNVVLHGFFSGPAQTRSPFDFLYGIIVVIVLLNVVIAIVSDAWQDAKERATIMYWEGRVSFLSESTFISNHFRSPFVENIFKWIDSAHLLGVNGNVSWERDYPYNQVKVKKQYDDPFHYFIPDTAKKIKTAHSLNSDLYWIKKQQSTKDLSLEPKYEALCAYFKWSYRAILYLLLLLIGFPTLGATWPQQFRIWLLSIGNSGEEDEQESERKYT